MKAIRFFVVGWATLLLGGPILVFACGPEAAPGTYVNAFDTPAGGKFVDPGFVTCGAVPGDGCRVNPGECCAGPGVSQGGECFDAGQPCPPGTGAVACNETADCLVHQSCCATPPQGGGYLTSACAASCSSAQIQLCRTNGECPGDECVIQRCPDGLIYEVCGLSTSPGFDCKAVPLLADGGLDLDGAP
ncbi:MAG: hypothetical protein ACLQVI_05625 [Polyangiaceae bacterium]